jgi:hypothetical protein
MKHGPNFLRDIFIFPYLVTVTQWSRYVFSTLGKGSFRGIPVTFYEKNKFENITVVFVRV